MVLVVNSVTTLNAIELYSQNWPLLHGECFTRISGIGKYVQPKTKDKGGSRGVMKSNTVDLSLFTKY